MIAERFLKRILSELKMKSDQRGKKIRNRWISIRVNEDEYKKIQNPYKATTCQAMREYTRNLLLNKPVTVKYRNTSLDDVLEEMIRLKNELNAIGKNFNQAVKRYIHWRELLNSEVGFRLMKPLRIGS